MEGATTSFCRVVARSFRIHPCGSPGCGFCQGVPMCFLQGIMQSGKGPGMQNLYDEVWKSYTTECGEVIRQGSDFDQKPDRETALSRDRSFKYTAGGAKPTQNLRFGQKVVGKLYDRVWGTYTTGGGKVWGSYTTGCGEVIRQVGETGSKTERGTWTFCIQFDS